MNSTDQNQNRKDGIPIKRTLAGGMIGAAFGFIATPENRKKLIENVDKDRIKNKSMQFNNKAKELSKQSIQNIKSKTADYFKKGAEDDLESSNDTEISATVEPIESEEFQQVMEENKELKNRLEKLESKLDQLSEGMKGQRKEEQKSSSSQQKKKNSTTSKKKDNDANNSKNGTNNTKQKNNSKKETDSGTGEKEKKDTALSSNDDTSS